MCKSYLLWEYSIAKIVTYRALFVRRVVGVSARNTEGLDQRPFARVEVRVPKVRAPVGPQARVPARAAAPTQLPEVV